MATAKKQLKEKAEDLSGLRAWLEYRHPVWTANIARWKYIRDHYTAEVLLPEKTGSYLYRRAQGEAQAAYLARLKTADYTNHLASIVDGLVGMLALVEDDCSRVFGQSSKDQGEEGKISGLGDPEDPDSAAARLLRNIDGHNTAYASFWHNVAIELTLMRMGWLVADSIEGLGGIARYLEPESVTNWLQDESEQILEIMVLESTDVRTTFRQKPVNVQQYLHLTREGWDRYRITGKTVTRVPEDQGGTGTWDMVFKTAEGLPRSPFFLAELPLKRDVGYYLSRKCNAIFNRESQLDQLVSTGTNPKYQVAGGATEFKAVKDAFAEGSNVIQGEKHVFTAPDMAPATVSRELLTVKTRELYMTGSREYGDAAAERTATELKQNAASGPYAFLALLTRTLDAAELQVVNLIEQIEFPDKPDNHYQFTVNRSTNYLPSDPETMIDRMITRLWGKDVPVPLGIDAQVAGAKQIAEWMGVPVNEDQIKSAVVARGLIDAMSLTLQLPWPAEAKVQAMAKVIASMGVIDPKDEITLADGTKKNLMEALLDQARELGAAQDLTTVREAQSFGGPPAVLPPKPVPPPAPPALA